MLNFPLHSQSFIVEIDSLIENRDQYSFLMPVMKALVDKCLDLLNMETYLPTLPSTTASPTFFDDFKKYCLSQEWTHFMERQVRNEQLCLFWTIGNSDFAQ